MKAKRASLTRKERATMVKAQGGLCYTWGCTGKPSIGEHHTPVALGNDKKPDYLSCLACAKRKTYGGKDGENWTPVGGDIRDIAHTKRIAEKRTQADKREDRGFSLIRGAQRLLSRGFDKSKTRTFAGKVVSRDR